MSEYDITCEEVEKLDEWEFECFLNKLHEEGKDWDGNKIIELEHEEVQQQPITIERAISPFIEEFKTRYKNSVKVFARHEDDPVKYLFKFSREDGFGDNEIIEEFCRGTGVDRHIVVSWRNQRYPNEAPII